MPLATPEGLVDDRHMDFFNAESLLSSSAVVAIDLSNDADPAPLRDQFHRIHTIRIAFPGSADGRGFSLAKQLRNLGYAGQLRAQGPLISDQFRYALACGFNEVEVAPSIAARQPEQHWQQTEQLSYREKLITPPVQSALPENVSRLKVTDVRHYSDTLFSFRVERPASFRFTAGEFVMLGIEHDDTSTYRAYSICSASWEDYLEFYSIKVPTGKFTGKLQWIRPGDSLLLKSKSTGSLVAGAIHPGKRLFLHATGTGIAPFISLIQEPDIYEQFEQIVLTHTCRHTHELRYGKESVDAVIAHELLGEAAKRQLRYLGTTTREAGDKNARITQLIESGALIKRLDIASYNPDHDRVLVCGSKGVNLAMRDLFLATGFTQGSLNVPGNFVWERAFVD